MQTLYQPENPSAPDALEAWLGRKLFWISIALSLLFIPHDLNRLEWLTFFGLTVALLKITKLFLLKIGIGCILVDDVVYVAS